MVRALKIKIFADGADLETIRALAADPRVSGFTTNPSLMRRAGVEDYRAFGPAALEAAGGKPVSFEVVGDDYKEMRRQALIIQEWGDAAFVKIPVVTTDGTSTDFLVADLAAAGIALNVTAVFTLDQVHRVCAALEGAAVSSRASIISVFAGRVADAGRNPIEHVRACAQALRQRGSRAELLWASPRQVYDVVLAERANCDIITMAPDLLAKLPLLGKDLYEFSRETAEMFYRDARAAGYAL